MNLAKNLICCNLILIRFDFVSPSSIAYYKANPWGRYIVKKLTHFYLSKPNVFCCCVHSSPTVRAESEIQYSEILS